MIEQYLTLKTEYKAIEHIIGGAVRKAFKEYAQQKHVVSTRLFKPWTRWEVGDFTIRPTNTTIYIVYHGQYGYIENQKLKIATSVIEIAAIGSDEDLKAAIAEIILEESKKFEERRLEEIADKTKQQIAEEDELLAAAEAIKKKRIEERR